MIEMRLVAVMIDEKSARVSRLLLQDTSHLTDYLGSDRIIISTLNIGDTLASYLQDDSPSPYQFNDSASLDMS